MAAKVGELEDDIREVRQHSKDNRKEVGRLEGTSALSHLLLTPQANTNMYNENTFLAIFVI